jgi:DNA primase
MALPPDFLDALRARVSLADVVGRRVKLARAGRELRGCCPFHNEKTPSFYVYPDHYHCFGCGAHGDAIAFTMEQDGLDFMGAVRALAAEAGLAVPEPRRDPAAEARTSLAELVAAAGRHYAAELAGPAGAEARAYLARRGVAPETARAFGLGFAPDRRDALLPALQAAFPALQPGQLVEAGLAGESDTGSGPGASTGLGPGAGARRYDRFRNRLMFPIQDARGRPVGFGGRALGDGQPKYLNSPEGPLFDKGRLLFNLDRAGPAARKAGRLVLVEGYMDVIGLAGVGIAEAAAPLGTALTEEQLRLAWRVADEPILAFDGDAAGRRAAARAAVRALPLLAPGRSLGFALLPAGQDPDDLAKAGREAVEAVLRAAVPLDRFLFETEAGAAPLDTPERRAALVARLEAHAATIADGEIRRGYRRAWRERAEAMWRMPREDARTSVVRARSRGRAGPASARPLPPLRLETRAAAGGPAEEALGILLAGLADRPGAAERHAEALAHLPLASPRLATLRDRLLDGGLAEGIGPAPSGLKGLADAEFDRRVGVALASLAELHHISVEMQPRDLSSVEAFRVEHERQARLRRAKDDALRRLAALSMEAGEGQAG